MCLSYWIGVLACLDWGTYIHGCNYVGDIGDISVNRCMSVNRVHEFVKTSSRVHHYERIHKDVLQTCHTKQLFTKHSAGKHEPLTKQ